MNTVDRVFTTIAQIWGVIFTLLLILGIVVYVKYGDVIVPMIKMFVKGLQEFYDRWQEDKQWEERCGNTSGRDNEVEQGAEATAGQAEKKLHRSFFV